MRKITLNKYNININKKLIKDTLIKNSKSKDKTKSSNNSIINNNKNNNKEIVPLLRINNIHKDINNINYFYKNERSHGGRMKGYIRHEGTFDNYPLYLGITKKYKHKKNIVF